MKNCLFRCSFLALLGGLLIASRIVSAQTTAFTYQGLLNNNGVPAAGTYSLEFSVYDGSPSGNLVGGPLTNAATVVSNGLFTVQLNFGAGVFTGAARWLLIGVRTNGSSAPFSLLSPSQPITSTPYAIQAAAAGSVAAANITGTVGAAQLPAIVVTNGAAGVLLTGTFTGDGSALSNLNINAMAANLTPLQTNNYSVPGNYTLLVPPGMQSMVVKLWGAGGGEAYGAGQGTAPGGGGAFVSSTLSVTPGDIYMVVVGPAGVASGNGGQTGFNDGSGGNSDGGGGGGGAASSLFKISGAEFIMKAVAGGGGGSGDFYFDAGGPGGNPGQYGLGSAGEGNAGGGGYNGQGGTSQVQVGGNYSTNAATIGETNLNLMGGTGGVGESGGGGGYGGGGGGNGIAGGGGGGSYGSQIIGGNGTLAGNNTDPNYSANLGSAANGGLAVVIFSGEVITSSNSLAATHFFGDGTTVSNVTAAGVAPGISITNATLINSTFYGNGVGLTNLSAASLTGVLATNQLPGNLGLLNANNGGGLTNLNATNVTGVVATNHLPASVAMLNRNQTFTSGNTFAATNQSLFNGVFARGGAPGSNGANNNGYAFYSNGGDTDSGMFSLGDAQLEFYINAVDMMDLSPAGLIINGPVMATNGNSFFSQGGFYETDRGGLALGQWTFYGHNERAYFYSSIVSADRMSIDTSGNVRALGTFISSTSPDLAETIAAANNVEMGDIVCADPQHRESVIRCGKDGHGILGVISDGSGGLLINSHGNSVDVPLTGKPLVLAGRVPVKICLENGPVQIGDTLAPSSIAGTAMRSSGADPTIGIALDNFSAADLKAGGKTGMVLCFVKAGENNAAGAIQRLQDAVSDRDGEIQLLKQRLDKMERMLGSKP